MTRRRVQIAVTVVVLSSITTWWYWPRGDSRFVGTWRPQGPTGNREILVLRSNASGGLVDGKEALYFTWQFDGETLVMDQPGLVGPGTAKHVPGIVHKWYARLFGGPISGRTLFRFKVLQIEPDTMRLLALKLTFGENPPITLNRISD
jgi:hypothetical protein